MKRKTKLDPRALMELAIEVMRQFVPEPRNDGKTSPKVGVVLAKPNGTVETACRGELRLPSPRLRLAGVPVAAEC